MCEFCDFLPAGVSRRALLAATGAATLAMIGCEREPVPKPPTTRPTSRPATASAPATRAAMGSASQPASQPATAPASQPATQASTEPAQPSTLPTTGPAPDLGAEVFPDATGKAIATIKDAPVIVVPRSAWTKAKPNLQQIALMNGISAITVHHTAWAIDHDAWRPTATAVENVRNFHSTTKPNGVIPNGRGWADIAYHFVIDRAGRVWQGRPLAYQGAHVKGHNDHNLGICLLGNFDEQSPSAAQLTSLGQFINFVAKLYDVERDDIFTHGELGKTSCPGKKLQDYMNRLRKQV